MKLKATNMKPPIGMERKECYRCEGTGAEYCLNIFTPHPLHIFGRESKKGNFVIEKPEMSKFKQKKLACSRCRGKGYIDWIVDSGIVKEKEIKKTASHGSRFLRFNKTQAHTEAIPKETQDA